jgi:two-component system response regulator HydG
LATQVKLLRVLEEMEIEKVGSHTAIPVDVRIISATNKDLNALIGTKEIREDFFFRINVFPIQCPSLLSRREDIPILAKNFIKQYTSRDKKNVNGMSSEAMENLMLYKWPGNIRELRNTIEYALVLCPCGLIGKEHLPGSITMAGINGNNFNGRSFYSDNERNELIEALKKTGGNQTETGKLLGVSRVTVWKRIKKYGVSI